jgi:AraC-like DNA-binding protein
MKSIMTIIWFLVATALTGQEQKLSDRFEALDDNTRTVSEISDRLGYSDYTKFSRAFKKSAGVTPKDYRKLRLEY